MTNKWEGYKREMLRLKELYSKVSERNVSSSWIHDLRANSSVIRGWIRTIERVVNDDGYRMRDFSGRSPGSQFPPKKYCSMKTMEQKAEKAIKRCHDYLIQLAKQGMK